MYVCKRCNWKGNEAQHGYCPNCSLPCVYLPSFLKENERAKYYKEISITFKERRDETVKRRFKKIEKVLNWRRGLGKNTVNEPFMGCEGHHIDEEHIVYIPRILHRSIYHNLKSGQGMEEINKVAKEFLDLCHIKD